MIDEICRYTIGTYSVISILRQRIKREPKQMQFSQLSRTHNIGEKMIDLVQDLRNRLDDLDTSVRIFVEGGTEEYLVVKPVPQNLPHITAWAICGFFRCDRLVLSESVVHGFFFASADTTEDWVRSQLLNEGRLEIRIAISPQHGAVCALLNGPNTDRKRMELFLQAMRLAGK